MTISQTTAPEAYRVVITSIGQATPASAAAVAKGLGIKAAEVIRCLYRAPAVLISSVEAHLAQDLQTLLANIGYDVEIQPCSDPEPIESPLYEVAVYLRDAKHFSQATKRLSNFLGMSEDDACTILMTPPGTALGSISEATVNAFIEHMDGCVEVTRSPQSEGLFHIFLGDTPILVRNRLVEDIKNAGIPLLDEQGLLAVNVPQQQVQHLWQRHKANTALRIVNQQFLRYDLLLIPPTDGSPLVLNAQQKATLMESSGIPSDMIDDVIAAAPIAILESADHDAMRNIMGRFDAESIPLQADLVTFQYLQLQVHSSPDTASLNNILASFNLPPCSGKYPQRIPQALPEIQARILQHTLIEQGHDIELVCP